ncbi:hypothetical protein IW262DRAFT_887122 [Armillaria fumosa]|nr:hypothetical protein IW262DRAFT_887122 [Armillaria fumosa]
MSLEDSVLCALISPGYEPCPTDPTALSNDLPWSYRGPFHHFENASPLSSTSSSSNSNNIFRSQSASPQDLRPTDEAFWLPDASSFSELDGSSTRAFNDIFREIYATNMPVVYACPYTPVPRQLTMRQSFEPSDVASTISHASRRNPPESSQPSHVELTCSPASENDSCLSSMSPSSSSYSQQSHFLTPPTFQPTDSVLTHGDASKSLATLDLWSTDAYLDGIDPGTDATNNFQDQTVEDFDFLNRIQGETDTIRDHGAASGIIGGRYDGMTFSTIAASIVPDTTRYNSVEGSAFYHDCPVSFARGGGNFGFRSQVNGKYGLNMNLPTRSTYPVGEPQEMINPGALENKHMYLEPSRMILHPGSHQAAEDTQELVSHDLAGDCYPAFQHAHDTVSEY